MFTKRTVIGTAIGCTIIAIGVAAFVGDLGLQTVLVDDTHATGEQASYRFGAAANSTQSLKITGELFDVEIATPDGGLQVPLTEYKDEAVFEWTHAADGVSSIRIRNTGSTDLAVTGELGISTDPIYFTYHVLVMISGIVIVGFSAGFSIRKPRGF